MTRSFHPNQKSSSSTFPFKGLAIVVSIILAILLLIYLKLVFGTSYSEWEYAKSEEMPYISAGVIAIEKFRHVHDFSNSLTANGVGTQLIWTDDKDIFINKPYLETSGKVESYIMNTGIFKEMRETVEKGYVNSVMVQKRVPNHKFCIVSVLPTIVVMWPFKYKITEFGRMEYDANNWGSDAGGSFLESDTISKGIRFPYSEDIKWFNCDSTIMPQPLIDMVIDLPKVKLVFKKEGDFINVYREK
jgi:hypothetical protein